MSDSSIPLFSVVIPNYNYGHFISTAVESVLSQSLQDFEIIIVDDGSTDGSRRVIEGFGNKVRLVPQRNSGVARARNRGAQEARGSFLAFLDADDFWHQRKLENQLNFLTSSGSTSCQTGYWLFANGEIGDAIPAPEGTTLERALSLRPCFSALSSTLLIRRHHFWEVGGFNERFSTSADYEFGVRLIQQGGLASIPEPLAYYRTHDKSMHLNLDLYFQEMRVAFKELLGDGSCSSLRKHLAELDGQTFRLSANQLDLSVLFRSFVSGMCHGPSTFLRRAFRG